MNTINSGRLEVYAAIVLAEPWRPKPGSEPQDPTKKLIKDIQSELNVSEKVAERIAKARVWQSSSRAKGAR